MTSVTPPATVATRDLGRQTDWERLAGDVMNVESRVFDCYLQRPNTIPFVPGPAPWNGEEIAGMMEQILLSVGRRPNSWLLLR